ncbi:MAG: winged helix-turn-helix transcriptional regulator [Candidatus Micrarchaeota archaeon]|nr:winged helix-turn-helix transcriptional regulator [Candidatus Micrarchaeota archaeon]
MDLFYAFAEPRRRLIVEMLARNGQMTATEISGNFDISPQAVSQHLGVLLQANILRMKKKAQRHIFQLNPASIRELEEWAKQTERLWDERLDRLDEVLKEEKKKNAKK